MNTKDLIILSLVCCILLASILFIFCMRKNEKYSVSAPSPSPNVSSYQFIEKAALDAGPISLIFYLTSSLPGPKPNTKLHKFIIDNNGKGYLSLFDLFCNGNINDKIAHCIEQGEVFPNQTTLLNYFTDSRYCKPPPDKCTCEKGEQVNVITISQLTLQFDNGVSYVNSLSKAGIGVDNLGDSWGSPIYFEIGGNKLPLPTFSQSGVLTQDLSTMNQTNFGTWKALQVNLFKQNYNVQFNNVKIVGNGQGVSSIRGSCIFIVYDLNKTSTSFGDGWFSVHAYQSFAERRLEMQGFLWTGHLGICTDYSLYHLSFPKVIKYNNVNIGSDPRSQSQKFYLPGYDHVSDSPVSDCTNLVLQQGSVELFVIDVWVELQQNVIAGAILPTNTLGYPLLAISNTSVQRIYFSNVTVMSYQLLNKDCKGLVFTNSGFLPVGTQFPGDIFMQQCAFAARNTNVTTGPGVTDAISFYLVNGDKLSIVNSTFHGQVRAECNKLAMFNCYCLHVGNPSIEDEDTDFTLANPAVVYLQANNENSASGTGYGKLKTSSRLIFQNMIFIVHLSGKALVSTSLQGHTLQDLYNNGAFKIGGKYDYYQKKTIFPFHIDTSSSLLTGSPELTNIFMQNCVYYAIIIGDSSEDYQACPYTQLSNLRSNSAGCPFINFSEPFQENFSGGPSPGPTPGPTPKFGSTTFSAITLTNIKEAFIDNFKPQQEKLGNLI